MQRERKTVPRGSGLKSSGRIPSGGKILEAEEGKNNNQNRSAEMDYVLHPDCGIFVWIQIVIPGWIEIRFCRVRSTGRRISSLGYVG